MKIEKNIKQQFYSVSDFATIFGISEPGVRARIYRKQIPFIKLMGRVMISAEWTDKMLKKAQTDIEKLNDLHKDFKV